MGLYIPYQNFSFVKNSNLVPFWLNIMEIQEWTKKFPVQKCTGIKYNDILNRFNVR